MSTAANFPLITGRERSISTPPSLRTRIGSLLFCIVTFEAALLGSGRMLEIGPVTGKMVLYVLALLYTIWSLLSLKSLKYSTILLLVSFGSLLCIGIVNGVVHGADMQYLSTDISPLISFLVLPFFELTIRNERDIRTAVSIIVVAALVMAACYAAIIFSVFSQRVSFETLYDWVGRVGGDDFIFEGETGQVFYKGTLFICIAFIFLVFRKGRWARTAAFILFMSLFVVGLRGFFLSLALCGIFYVFIGPLSAVKKVGIGFVVVSLAVALFPWFFALFGDKAVSNNDRLTAISEVYERITPSSIVVGHGLGIGVPVRTGHMEIIYLEIFHKQGVIGLLWWAILIGIAMVRWKRAVRVGKGQLAYPLFLAIIFVCIESATNPFLNNPIGLYAFIICYVGLGVIAESSNRGSVTSLVQNPRAA
jgi:hypothetical protein